MQDTELWPLFSGSNPISATLLALNYVDVDPLATSPFCLWTAPLVVSSLDLIRRVYRFQYNAWENVRDTESDPHWSWFWVWDRDYLSQECCTTICGIGASVAGHIYVQHGKQYLAAFYMQPIYTRKKNH